MAAKGAAQIITQKTGMAAPAAAVPTPMNIKFYTVVLR